MSESVSRKARRDDSLRNDGKGRCDDLNFTRLWESLPTRVFEDRLDPKGLVLRSLEVIDSRFFGFVRFMGFVEMTAQSKPEIH
jgi:hypothetical protein